jgi:hypothetical protein
MNPTKINDATEAYLSARELAQDAEALRKAAEAEFVATLEDAGIDYGVTSDGVRVAVENRPRRTIDIGVLMECLTDEVIQQVIKTVVDTKAFDAAVKVNLIDENVADKAVRTDYSTQVRVYGDRVVGER